MRVYNNKEELEGMNMRREGTKTIGKNTSLIIVFLNFFFFESFTCCNSDFPRTPIPSYRCLHPTPSPSSLPLPPLLLHHHHPSAAYMAFHTWHTPSQRRKKYSGRPSRHTPVPLPVDGKSTPRENQLTLAWALSRLV